MKIKNLFVVALASIVALAACKKEPVVTPPADLTIKLNAAVYGFTKATDTAFEAGDAMGVNVYEGENSYIFNAKFTYNGSALTSVTFDIIIAPINLIPITTVKAVKTAIKEL